MAEGLSASEVGKEIAEHHEHAQHAGQAAGEHAARDRVISIVEALILSIVALLAAWSGYSAAKWGTESSASLAKASTTRNKSNLASTEALQIRTLDSVSFNAVVTAYVAHDARAFRVTVNRLRPGYRPAFNAWVATHPFTNPSAPPGPSYMPQYRIPQDAQARTLNTQADALFNTGEDSAGTADKYVRLTVLLAAVLFLVGIGSRFPLRAAATDSARSKACCCSYRSSSFSACPDRPLERPAGVPLQTVRRPRCDGRHGIPRRAEAVVPIRRGPTNSWGTVVPDLDRVGEGSQSSTSSPICLHRLELIWTCLIAAGRHETRW